MYPSKHIALICNPVNERAISVADSVAALLKEKQVPYSIFTAYWPQQWNEITDAWVFGGDGTLNYFINQYPEFSLPISVFAGGSGNDFHWLLYDHMALRRQVDYVLNSSPKLVDAGRCNGKLFINGVGIGFDGAIVHDLLGKKKRPGKASYFLSILKHIVSYKERWCSIQSADLLIEQSCFMISVANGRRYGGGFLVAPKASVDDDMLDVNIVGEISPYNRMRHLPTIEKGEHLHLPFVQYQLSKQVIIKSAFELPAHMDGEAFSAKEFTIDVLPKRFSFIY